MSEEVQAAEETNTAEAPRIRRRKEREGVVVKASAQKTVVVQVSRRIKHPRYKKYVTRRKRYAVHDTVGVTVGDFVKIRETRPLSKTKRWQVVGKTVRHS
jgi:small subunit ribosomal protein S17